MTQNNKSISPLRQRMVEDMVLRKLSERTQSAYIRAVKNLTGFLGRSPDAADDEDLRRYQLLRELPVLSLSELQEWTWAARLCSSFPAVTSKTVRTAWWC